MKRNKITKLLVYLLVAVTVVLPTQGAFCHDVESTEKVVPEDTKKQEVSSTKNDESSLSTPKLIGIGVGAAALIGGVAALGGGGGGGDGDVAVQTPPTSDQLVSAWHAEGNQPGSGLTYSGTFQLYQNGGLAYNLYVSDGEHLVGGGSWRLNGYTLYIRTDHGSVYSGNVPSGNVTSLSLNSNTGWNLTLTR